MRLDREGAANLIGGMIRQAKDDYRLLERRGMIVAGQANVPEHGRRSGGYKHRPEVKDLVEFFQPGGAMDRWLDWMGYNDAGDTIRRQIGFKTTVVNDLRKAATP